MSREKELQTIFRRFLKATGLLQKKEKWVLCGALGIMVITGFLTNAPAVILGRFVDTIIALENPSFEMAIPFLILIIAIVVVRELLTIVRKYLIENIATQIEKKQTVDIIRHLLQSDIQEFIKKYQIGALHGKVFRSIQGLIRLLKLGFLDFLPMVFAALAALIIVFSQNSILASFMILVIPAGLFIISRQITSQKGVRISLLREKEKIDGHVVEMMNGIETIRVANTIELETSKVEKIAENLRKIEMKHHIWMAVYDACKYLNEAFFYVLVVSISIYFAVNGVITKGDILTYSILFMSILSPLREIHRILDEAHESAIKLQDLFELKEQPIDQSFHHNVPEKESKQEYVLETKNLSFHYGGKDTILKNINIQIPKGAKIGIAGPSGCGKTTLLKILLRIIHRYEGEISFFGHDLRALSREEIAKKISYISQQSYLFSGTIAENIAYGSDTISEDALIAAAVKANIYDEIEKDLGGFSGRVSENGNNLSGGQKQRICLARLILKSPQVLIFDEATSALDNTNENIIQQNIEAAFQNATIITIAHRLTTLKNSDTIFVFDKGMIVQEGTFSELAEEEGLFQQFLHQGDS